MWYYDYLKKIKTNFSKYLKLVTVNSSKGSSRRTTKYVNKVLPLYFKHTKLVYSRHWLAGRSRRGTRILRTRGSQAYRKQTKPAINYRLRDASIRFIGGFNLIPFSNKLVSLVFMSSGATSYITTTDEHTLFFIFFVKSFTRKKYRRKWKLRVYNQKNWKNIFREYFYLIAQLVRSKPVSLLEVIPGGGVKCIRSPGTKGKIMRRDLRVSTSLIKLPSGVRKVFSTFSLGSSGFVTLSDKKKLKNPLAGFKNGFGKKPIVRGVAQNPIDHPHGGRTKAIKYQRTPWGKTTKYK